MLKEIVAQIEALTAKLRRRQIQGSDEVAIATARLLRNVVAASRCKDVPALSKMVRDVGSKLQAAQPIELAVGNMVQRVLHLIAEEANAAADESDSNSDPDSAADSDTPTAGTGTPRSTRSKFSTTSTTTTPAMRRSFVANVKQSVEEMIDELENTTANISNQAWEHIHSKEIILTLGYSSTVAHFLEVAAQVRDFQVIVAETSPTHDGHTMAAALARAGIDTTVITDSAIFAVMSRVNKVILGAHAVTANGGCVAVCGTKVVALAAKQYSTPVVVCTGLHKVSPSYPYDTEAFGLLGQPGPVYAFEAGDIIDSVEIVNPLFDYIGPEDVSLFITNVGTHPPSFIQRLVHDNYLTEQP
ncbi:uncharacterized protein EV422DRAFT_549861 [Fimicolochytrium jonesii]|uniref:uncharacterized protein n=1 Tax=Fimicolochytrium jonesii TaxID=1396493 RepID=UPI0022FF27C5|nr:uncharacterized protein EV422DRAFT_549861 [Fimicolochytrium jonesii]KAI8824990.1 hypothetical protein EV422DRAFT_549861 [Fimicolochytrium jonesii]